MLHLRVMGYYVLALRKGERHNTLVSCIHGDLIDLLVVYWRLSLRVLSLRRPGFRICFSSGIYGVEIFFAMLHLPVFGG